MTSPSTTSSTARPVQSVRSLKSGIEPPSTSGRPAVGSPIGGNCGGCARRPCRSCTIAVLVTDITSGKAHPADHRRQTRGRVHEPISRCSHQAPSAAHVDPSVERLLALRRRDPSGRQQPADEGDGQPRGFLLPERTALRSPSARRAGVASYGSGGIRMLETAATGRVAVEARRAPPMSANGVAMRRTFTNLSAARRQSRAARRGDAAAGLAIPPGTVAIAAMAASPPSAWRISASDAPQSPGRADVEKPASHRRDQQHERSSRPTSRSRSPIPDPEATSPSTDRALRRRS